MSSLEYCHKEMVQFFFTDTKTFSRLSFRALSLPVPAPATNNIRAYTKRKFFLLFDVLPLFGVTGPCTDSNHCRSLDSKLFWVPSTYLDFLPLERWKRQFQFIKSTVFPKKLNTTWALNVNRKFHQANRYILSCKLASTCMKEQHLSKRECKSKKGAERRKISNFSQNQSIPAAIQGLDEVFLKQVLKEQFKNILPLQ